MPSRQRLAPLTWLLGILLLVLLPWEPVWAAYTNVCVADDRNPPSRLVDVQNSYCEFCGYGYVEVEITNPYRAGTNAPDGDEPYETRVIQEWYNPPGPGGWQQRYVTQSRRNPDYGSQDPSLDFDNNSLTIALTDGLERYTGTAPTLPLGGNVSGSTTITVSNMADLGPGGTEVIRIPVHRRPDNTPEALYNDTPQARATINYRMDDNCQDDPGRRYNWRGNGWYDNTGGWNDDPDNPPTDFWQNYNQPGNQDTGNVDILQPELSIDKQGWNYDSGQRQNTRSDTVYGHNDDDIVWRLNVANWGDAPLQDLRIDDVLSRADVMNVHYACPSSAAANAVAANDGVLPGGSSCIATDALTGSVLSNWDLMPPFGFGDDVSNPYADTMNAVTPGSSSDAIDIAQGGNINIYLVGKLQGSASCSSGTPLVNRFEDVEFGCAVQTPPGGIDSGLDDTGEVRTRYGQGPVGGGPGALEVERTLTGIDGSDTVGMRGLMTITLSNQSGGTVWFDQSMAYHLRDELPDGYVLDPSYEPRLLRPDGNDGYDNGALYGSYAGQVDELEWVNPAGGVDIVDTGNYTDYLNNTAPEFRLLSSTQYQESNPDGAYNTGRVYRDLMRHGDVAVIRFAIIHKEAAHFDRAADLDVVTEIPGLNAHQHPGEPTDPPALGNLQNTLEVEFKTLCDAQGQQNYSLQDNGTSTNPTDNTSGRPITFDPEDLDVEVLDPSFIVTNDPNQTTPLRVEVTNNGGVKARDASVFVSFGPTLEVMSVQEQNSNWTCENIAITGSPVPQPLPYKAWVINPPGDPNKLHLPLTTSGTVYRCYPTHPDPLSRVLAPGASEEFHFEVRKSTDPAKIQEDDVTFRVDALGEIWTVSDLALADPTVQMLDTGGSTDNRIVQSYSTTNTPTAITNDKPLWFPQPGNSSQNNARMDGEVDRGNLYSLDANWSRGIGFNLLKDQVAWSDSGGDVSAMQGAIPTRGECNEDSPATTADALPDSEMSDGFPNFARKVRERVQIGEECTNRIQTGGWFGFQSRGFSFIGVRDVQLQDEVQDGLVFLSSTQPQTGAQIAGATSAPNSPLKLALDEGIFGWFFTGNQPGSDGRNDYIVDIDQWFHINTTTRIQNKVQNDRAAPNMQGANRNNVLNSSFNATYHNENTGEDETFPFGSDIVGYPWERIRRTDVVVTEPRVEIVKDVCAAADFDAVTGNCGAGWTADYQGAVTTSDYIYRLTVSNEAEANGHPRAPAYDLIVEDTLPDLLRIVDTAADGIDNDGDNRVDAADADGESTIVGNVMNDGNDTIITFSHEQGVDGTGLRRLDPGSSLHLYYQVDPDDRIAPSEMLTNIVQVSYYDSLAGSLNEHGQQTVVMPGSGALGGARTYPAAADENTDDEASLTFIEPTTEPKTITAMAETLLAGGGTQQTKIGEEIEYTLTAELPVTQLRDLTVTDNLPTGLSCSQAPTIDLSNDAPWDAAGFKRPDLSGVGDVIPICNDDQVQWAFGDVVLTNPSADRDPNRFTFQLSFIARVDNLAANNDGDILSNGEPATTATLEWEDETGTGHSLDYGQVDVLVTEPEITASNFIKAWDIAAHSDAGDEVTVTVTVTNTGTASAYNLRVLDALHPDLSYVSGSVVGAGAPDSVDETDPQAPVFVWADNSPLAVGATREFTFRVSLDTNIQPRTELANSLVADWTSLPGQSTALNPSGLIGDDGSATGMRIGSLDNSHTAPNDYVQTSNEVEGEIRPLALTKTDLTPALEPEIGAHKQFELVIDVPEGTTNTLQVSDILNSGAVSYVLARDANFDVSYTFTGIASINGQAPGEAAFNSAPADGASGTVLWDIGTVVTDTENDLPTAGSVSPQIRITYFARINNDLNTNAGSTLQNAAKVDYTDGQTGGPAPTLNDNTTAVTAIESDLSASKNYTNVSGGPLTGGSVLEYTVTLNNNGDATAYDLNIADTLPSGLELDDSFTATATINGTDVPGFVAVPTDAGGGKWIWGRESGDASLDLPAGQELVLTYRTIITLPGGTFTNAMAADWTSLQGDSDYQRTGEGCPVITAPDDYCVSADVTTGESSDDTAITKSFASDTWDDDGSNASDSLLRVGDTVDYRLTLTLNESTTGNVVLTDTLPVGLAFEQIVSVNGDTAAPFDPVSPFSHTPVAAPTIGGDATSGQTLTFSLGDIDNAVDNNTANNDVVIIYRARVVEDVLAHQATLPLNNAVVLAYTLPGGTPAAHDPARMESAAAITANQPVMSTITKVERSGRVSPYDVMDLVGTTMQFQLQTQNNGDAPAYNLLFTDTLAPQLDETSLTTPVVSVDGTALAAADFDYTAPAARGDSFTVKLNVPVMPGDSVTVDYDIGFHTDVPPNDSWNNNAQITEYWSLPGADGQRYAPTDLVTFTMQNPMTDLPVPLKTLVTPTDKAVIGEEVEYRITVPGETLGAALDDVQVTDTLSPDLEFVSATVADPAHGLIDNGSSGQTVDLTLTQIPAGQQAEITLIARVVNTADSNAGDTVTNIASYTFDGDTLSSEPSAPLTLAEPQVTLTKDVTAPASISAGTVLDYTLELSAATGANAADAQDLVLTDTLDPGLVYETGSANIGDPDTVSGDGISTPQVLTWNIGSLPEGQTDTITYQVTLQDTVSAGQTLNNTAEARWTSLAGDSDYERDGSETPAHNDYVTRATRQVTTTDSTAFDKAVASDTYAPQGDAVLRVGDRVNFELRLNLQEGSHQDLVVTDALPDGMGFEQVVSVDQFGNPGSLPAPTVSGQTVTFEIGDITNPADGDASNDVLVITYQARVLNESALSHQPLSQMLDNQAQLSYSLASGPATPIPASASVDVRQPLLEVASVTAVTDTGNDAVITANETVTYTVDIVNNGQAPAYDVQIQEALPVGLRQDGVTTQSIALLSGANLPMAAPSYDPATGTALWDLDGTANAWTIPAGDTLRLVYTATGHATLGAGLSLDNSVSVPLYHSFDNGDVPADGLADERQIYGPSDALATTVTTPLPGGLLKDITQPEATIGEQFAYRITVPETPAETALYDVQILDDLSSSAADLRFVSVSKVGGSEPWTPENTGTDTDLVIEDSNTGITIPAGEQITVDVVVELLNTDTNVAGLVFNNTATYQFSTFNGDTTTLADTSPDMTITEPDSLVLEKTGPASLQPQVDGNFRIDVQNTGSARAWDLTVQDLLPDTDPGGMCDNAPLVTSAQVFEADGTTAVSPVLTEGTDYQLSYDTSTCLWTVTALSQAASVGPQERLIIDYTARLDNDAVSQSLTNIAAATQWYSQDTDGSGASGETRAYSRELTDGTPTVVDHEDIHTLDTETAVIGVEKTVYNVTTGQSGATAAPGDRLRYSVTINNVSDVPLNNFDLFDELGVLNGDTVFQPGTLAVVTLPAGATDNSDASGGSAGSGRVSIQDLTLGEQGSATESVIVEFEVDLAPVITSGTVVLNQAHIESYGIELGLSDDPAVNGAADPLVAGDEDPTETLIDASPAWRMEKTVTDLTGEPDIHMAGDTLRYSLLVQNIGGEHAENVTLTDLLPAFTDYVPGSTTLNGQDVADLNGSTPLAAAMLIHAPGNPTSGVMEAGTADNIALVQFDVVIKSDVLDGTVISNQGYVNGDGVGSGAFEQAPSDDPNTTAVNDPTRIVVGNLPLLTATKTVEIQVDNGTPDVVDAGDTLRYTIVVQNSGAQPATHAEFTDPVPDDTTYVAGSSTLNTQMVADIGGDSPWLGGYPIQSPGEASGTIAGQATATITFDVVVDAGTPEGTIISNQGEVASEELPTELTDADGDRSNGYQSTDVVVGSGQMLLVTKQVMVVGGGPALPGSELEYLVQVRNTGSVPATDLVITDDLTPLENLATLVAGSASLNGVATDVSVVNDELIADYGAINGDLPPNGIATLRFRMLIEDDVPLGTSLINTAVATWNDPLQTAQASVSLDVGGMPGTAMLNGQIWHDTDFDNTLADSESRLADWTVTLHHDGNVVGTVLTDAEGTYTFVGLPPTVAAADYYELRFLAPGATMATAKLGMADSDFTDGLQQVTEIKAGNGSNVQGLNLPIDPNGVVYNSVSRQPVSGARLTLLDSNGTPLASSCFEDPAQQDQVTLASGFYKFDLTPGVASCQSSSYQLEVTAPGGDYEGGVSQLILPTTDGGTSSYDVQTCTDDAVAATTACEAQPQAAPQPPSVPAESPLHGYYLHLTFSDMVMPDDSQIFNNHIPLDPVLDGVVSISKTAGVVNVSRGGFVPYVIRINNRYDSTLNGLAVVDSFPPGFKFVEGSARLDDQPVALSMEGRQLILRGLDLQPDTEVVLKMLFIVGSGVGEGEYVNRAQVFQPLAARALNGNSRGISGEASAAVRVVPDPDFDCSDVIGKVYDDRNMNGYQDDGEGGLPNVRAVTAQGLIVTSDEYGRFHITCAVVPNELRGSNFILKVDDRSLPTGYRLTTENPLVRRATRGKMVKFNFGAALHRVVRLDLADGVFKPDTTEMRLQWQSRVPLLMEQLQAGPSLLRLAYMAETESPALVKKRLKTMEKMIANLWAESGRPYELVIETEVFWRTGAPLQGGDQ